MENIQCYKYGDFCKLSPLNNQKQVVLGDPVRERSRERTQHRAKKKRRRNEGWKRTEGQNAVKAATHIAIELYKLHTLHSHREHTEWDQINETTKSMYNIPVLTKTHRRLIGGVQQNARSIISMAHS